MGVLLTRFLLGDKTIKTSSISGQAKVLIGLLVLCSVMGFAVSANACDYRARFLQECGWLATQQQFGGGVQESENCTSGVESDNTQEAIWIWSRYAELTGDYTTYQTRINNAWTYCIANPCLERRM